jgi:hypothetical protein
LGPDNYDTRPGGNQKKNFGFKNLAWAKAKWRQKYWNKEWVFESGFDEFVKIQENIGAI